MVGLIGRVWGAIWTPVILLDLKQVKTPQLRLQFRSSMHKTEKALLLSSVQINLKKKSKK